MTIRGFFNWLAFASYLALFLCLPLGLLWSRLGVTVGLVATAVVLVGLRVWGSRRILKAIGARELWRAEAPTLFLSTEEYCRRLQLPIPQLAVIETSGLNIAVFGFRKDKAYLVLTRGLLNGLSRKELQALIARATTYLWHQHFIVDSWLAQFLMALEWLTSPRRHTTAIKGRYTPFRLFFTQTVLYPLALVPRWLLRCPLSPKWLDEQSARVSRLPLELGSAYRKMEMALARSPFTPPLGIRHLFLIAPPIAEPLPRLFFGDEQARDRIQHLERALTRQGSLT